MLSKWLAERRKLVLAMGGFLLVALVAALGVAINLAAASFTLLAFTAAAAAGGLLGWRPLEALPELEVGLWSDGQLVTTYTRTCDRARRPIDIDAIVHNAVAAVRRDIPPDPAARPKIPGLNVAAMLAEYTTAAHLSGLESREAAVERLERELEEYEPELRKWLEEYKGARWPTYATISAKVALYNGGENAADDITLRMTIPDRLVPVDTDELDQIELEPPPEPPKYEQRSSLITPLHLPEYAIIRQLGELTAITRSQRFATSRARDVADGPSIRTEHGQQVARVRLDALTHGVTVLSADTLDVLPRRPGTYELPWEAHVSNLRRPARGTITLEVGPMPEAGAPLVTVASVTDSGDVKLLADESDEA